MLQYQSEEYLEREYIDNNRTATDIAKDQNVSVHTIRYWIQKLDLPKKDRARIQGVEDRRYRNEEWLEKQYRGEKKSINEIADECGVSYPAVWNALSKFGIERRSRAVCGEKHGMWKGEELNVECDWCGKTIRKRKPQIENFDHHFCDNKCRGKWASENMRGENSPRWNEDVDYPYNYGGHNWRKARKKALERDDHQCQICGAEGNLNVHHIKPFKTFNDFHDANKLSNLITLCRECHMEVESDESPLSYEVLLLS